MEEFLIKECGLEDIEKIKYISEKTFCETFSNENTKEWNVNTFLNKYYKV